MKKVFRLMLITVATLFAASCTSTDNDFDVSGNISILARFLQGGLLPTVFSLRLPYYNHNKTPYHTLSQHLRLWSYIYTSTKKISSIWFCGWCFFWHPSQVSMYAPIWRMTAVLFPSTGLSFCMCGRYTSPTSSFFSPITPFWLHCLYISKRNYSI